MQIREGQDDAWQEWRDVNIRAGGYSEKLIHLSEKVGELMELALANSLAIADALEVAAHSLEETVPTIMFDHILQNLANFWIYGDELLKYHNNSLGASKEVIELHTKNRWMLSLHADGHLHSRKVAVKLRLNQEKL